MTDSQSDTSNNELQRRLKTLMLLRVIFLTLFLGVVVIFQKRGGEIPALIHISFLIGLTYFLTILYAILLRNIKNLILFSYVQIIGDIIIEAGVNYVTGGVQSTFSFLYIFSIITASIIISRKGGYIIASFSSVIYGTMANLELYNFISPASFYGKILSSLDPGYVFYLVFFNILAFFLVAFLSGNLSERLKITGKELRREKDHLIKLQSFNENIVNSIESGLFTTDINGKINFFNKTAEKLTSYEKNEVIGKFFYEVFVLPDLSDSTRNISLDSTDPKRYEGIFKRKDKKEIFLGMSFSPFRDEKNTIQGIIGIFQNITLLKEMEEKIRKKDRLAAIGEIAAGIAHEIRNPLTSISGSVQLLKDTFGLKKADRQLMDIVIREAERLNTIISNFLNYARPVPLVVGSYNINEIINETIGLFKNNKEYRSDIEISTDFKQKKINAMVDPKQIKQVFWNLYLNSAQAMPEGGVLRIETHYCDDNERSKIPSRKLVDRENINKFIEINIKDSGTGISQQDIGKIFEPFYTTKEGGNGLGLAIVYRIIENHKGIIEVKSKPGGGTAFQIFLPSQ